MAPRLPRGQLVLRTLLPPMLTALAFDSAQGDTLPSVDVRTWAPSTDPRASLVVEPTSSPGHLVFSAGTFLHYENDSVVLRSPQTGAVVARPLANQVGLDVTANLGLGARSAVGIRVPVSIYEQGSSGLPPSVISSGQVPSSAFGDLAVVGKATLVEADATKTRHFGLAAVGSLSLPTGAKTSFQSDGAPVATVRLLADLSLRVASFQASAGYTLRASHQAWPAITAGGVTFGDEIPWTLGVAVRPAAAPGLRALDPGDRQTWEVALHGSLPAGPALPFGSGDKGSAALSPVLLALSERVLWGHYKDGFVLAGADLGLDRAVGVPSVRLTVGVGWAFRNHDQDGDGVADDLDQCPQIAEDRDGFEDADGCPEVDNDDDGIIDAEDACPNVAGPPSVDPRKNGCPADVLLVPPATR